MDSEARVLGNINKETKFVLKYFDIPEPKYLNDVKIQIRNMKYLKGAYINEKLSIEDAFNKMNYFDVTGLPMVDDEKKLKGYVNLKDISRYMISYDIASLNTSYANIIKILNAKSILKFDDEINGIIESDFEEIKDKSIIIINDNISLLEKAINHKSKLVIISEKIKMPAELLVLASKNLVNIISVVDTTNLYNRLKISNYISTLCVQNNPIFFKISDYKDEFISTAEKTNHTNYPVVDNNNHCVGMIRLADQNNYDKCKCILVDHNEDIQSVDGIEEANILEVIDHHNIGLFGSNFPISFRAMPVGCTATIIYEIYKENNVEIPKNIAGLMLSAILSDTLLFKSPTTTELDINNAKKLAEIAEIDIDKYGMEMFKAGTSIKGMNCHEVFEQDFKSYKVDNYNIGISQVMTLNIDNIMDKKEEYIELLNDMENLDYKIAIMFVTDVIKNGSYIFYNTKSKDILSNIYQLDDLEQGLFLSNMISRKKQMLPKILDYLQK